MNDSIGIKIVILATAILIRSKPEKGNDNDFNSATK